MTDLSSASSSNQYFLHLVYRRALARRLVKKEKNERSGEEDEIWGCFLGEMKYRWIRGQIQCKNEFARGRRKTN
jgi:hypothetical protein